MRFVKTAVIGLLLTLAAPLAAFAQCSGQAPSLTYCGNPTGALALPGWKPFSGLPFPSIAGGTVVGNRGTTSATATAITNPILGIPGTSTGQLGLAGATSGTVTILPQAAAGTYNFNLPTGAGTSGQPLLSGGGGSSPMTFGTLAVAAGGTGLTSGTSGGIPYFSSTSAMASSALLAANQLVLGGGAGTAPVTLGSLGTTTTVLHGNAAGAPTFGAVVLTTDVSGILPEANGGTNQSTYTLGDILYASAANTLSKLAGNTTAAKQYLSQTGTGAVSAAPAWATIAGGDITGAALTKVDDTNVTLTLGGTPTTALLRAASLTLGWTGQLALTRGGTAASLTASNGGIVYSTSSALAILSGTATANQIVMSGSSAAPSWSTATYPATTTAGTVLASASANTVTATATPTLGANGGTGGQITLSGSTSGTAVIRVAAAAGTGTIFQLPANNGTNTYVLQTDGTGVTSWVAAAGGGTVTTLTAGTGISFSSGATCTTTCTVTNSGATTVSNSDSTLTISPTSGAVVASLNLGRANTWTAAQSFPASGIKLKGSSTGYTTFASANASATNYTLTFPAITSTVSTTIASGAKALATGAISSGACTTAQTDTATGALTTDSISASFSADPTSTTGYSATTNGMLTIIAYPTADTVNLKVCNNTSASITPGAVTINWRVVR